MAGSDGHCGNHQVLFVHLFLNSLLSYKILYHINLFGTWNLPLSTENDYVRYSISQTPLLQSGDQA